VLRRRLSRWLSDLLARDLAPLMALRAATERTDIAGPLRGILFQLCEGLGAVPHAAVAEQVAALDAPSRKLLARLGARAGTLHLFVPGLFRPRAIRRRALLWTVHRGEAAVPPSVPALFAGKLSVAVPAEGLPSADLARALGYMALGPRALRLDQAERLAAQARKLARQGPFAATSDLAKLAGAEGADLASVLGALGYRKASEEIPGEAGERFVARRPKRFHRGHGKPSRPAGRKGRGSAPSSSFAVRRDNAAGSRAPSRPSDSPFAQLGELLRQRREQGPS
jgi:ATP-dependent RNA helicase SUPV3L1/SUV3